MPPPDALQMVRDAPLIVIALLSLVAVILCLRNRRK